MLYKPASYLLTTGGVLLDRQGRCHFRSEEPCLQMLKVLPTVKGKRLEAELGPFCFYHPAKFCLNPLNLYTVSWWLTTLYGIEKLLHLYWSNSSLVKWGIWTRWLRLFQLYSPTIPYYPYHRGIWIEWKKVHLLKVTYPLFI